MKTTLKLITAVLILSLTLTLASCGQSKPSEQIGKETKGTEAATPSTTGSPTTDPETTGTPATESIATEPATAEPVETDPPAPDEPGMPSQHYVGTWYTDESKEMVLNLYEITPDSIVFRVKPAPGESSCQLCASEVDGIILFGNRYVPNGYKYDDNLAGSLEFSENGITVTFEDFGDSCRHNAAPPPGTAYVYTIKSETDLIDWPSDKVPEGAAGVIQDAVDEMEEKGWTDIEVFPHEPDYLHRWQIFLDPYPLEDGEMLFSVVGRAGKTYSVVFVTLGSSDTNAKRAEVFYIGFNGRCMRGVYLDSFLNGESSPDTILQADDQEMQYYFWEGN